MLEKSTASYWFGDLLGLARQSWTRERAIGLAAVGYHDYRRSDPAVMRLLPRGPMPIGRLGDALGVTRQAARKITHALERRGFATTARDERDTRQINVSLSPEGEAYARSIVIVIERLNRDLCRRVDAADLLAADRVLRAALADAHARELGEHVDPPPMPTLADAG
jgi:DNA-binding MarR family transcriptional regulator